MKRFSLGRKVVVFLSKFSSKYKNTLKYITVVLLYISFSCPFVPCFAYVANTKEQDVNTITVTRFKAFLLIRQWKFPYAQKAILKVCLKTISKKMAKSHYLKLNRAFKMVIENSCYTRASIQSNRLKLMIGP